jgi:D-tyrosyl-tRNA(Tyr) deacylase
MRACVQRVSRAAVWVGEQCVGKIDHGLVVLLGVADGDTDDDASRLADKIATLRVFEDADGKMNRSVAETAGQVLVVSQFTLLGDCRKGRRPSFAHAAAPETAERFYRSFVERLEGQSLTVATGVFREHMQLELVNDGPVTLLLDSRRHF